MTATAKRRSAHVQKSPRSDKKSINPLNARSPQRRVAGARPKKRPRTIADLMQTDVVSASAHDTLSDVIALMSEHHVSGLPVVNSKNHCVGVISMSDVMAYVESQQEESEGTHDSYGRIYNRDTEEWESARLSAASMDEYGSTPVTEIMTADIVWVPPTATVEAVAKLMVKENVHRVLVLDAEKHLQGLVSAFDLVRVLAGEA